MTMKMFFAQLNDQSSIHVQADRMVVDDGMIYIYDGDQLVALADVSVVLHAHFSAKAPLNRGGGIG